MRCEPMENCTGKTHRKGSLWTNYRSPRNRVRRAKLLDCVFLFGLECLGRQFSCWHPGLIPHWHLVATSTMTHTWRQSKTDLLIDTAICHSAAFKELQCFQTTNSLFSYHGSTSEERKQLLYQGTYMLAGSLIVILAFVLQCICSDTSDECHHFQVPATLEWALLLIWHLRLQVADLLKYTDYFKVKWNWQSNTNYTSLSWSLRGRGRSRKRSQFFGISMLYFSSQAYPGAFWWRMEARHPHLAEPQAGRSVYSIQSTWGSWCTPDSTGAKKQSWVLVPQTFWHKAQEK